MTKYDLVHTRKLQCLYLKQDFTQTKLGVRVGVVLRVRQGTSESEFDLLSLEDFKEFKVRRSVQGLLFQYWLPLPISWRHFQSVKDEAKESLLELASAAELPSPTPVDLIYSFMNNVIVKLSQQASKSTDRPAYSYAREEPASTLKLASEKAIESYFHLFHLLLCLATENDVIVR